MERPPKIFMISRILIEWTSSSSSTNAINSSSSSSLSASFRPYNQNHKYFQPRPWEDTFQNFKHVSHSMIEQQNRTIDELRNEMRTGFNSQAQSISNLEKMVGHLASSVQALIMTVEKDKFPCQPVPNPKGVHEVSTSSWRGQSRHDLMKRERN